MDKLDLKILKAINTISPTTFIGATEVSDKVKMDKNELGDRLIFLKKSGHLDTITKELYPA